ncbi:multidrug efflux pump subunit AcrA (membrane-fusion protein) [Desulfobaculum xiamenense]|uniref:Multidrug efflux pump subunit AcrA (Membrane-fusion protein) n=1 Tax=Desulfobaculum xiamenense TaxID=995050 RepID=A0A846QSU8_9BACT|nr:efflux RND transporter periplasmic adaptor subunit [Desulfobaculum xiamenense]NJB67719.1 multidrug efflux pump subunit AcrA (membrane-fusion protein) [Desulfobaculum xiamenense]
MQFSRRMLALPVAALGIVLFVALVRTKSGPKRLDVDERARAVRVITAPEVALVPRVVGYGSVRPAQVWEAVAEVGGRVVEMHPSLKRGAILPAGAVLLRIDQTEYRLKVAAAEAEVQSALARLRELEQKKINTERLFAVESESLTLGEAELQRRQRLLETGTISRSEYDREERSWLAQRNAVQGYRSTLDLIPAERRQLSAALDAARSRLEDARLDLGRTVITAPFECRIGEVGVELSQYAKVGQTVAVADSIGASEVSAQVPIAAFLRLVRPGPVPLVRNGDIDMDDIRRAIGVDGVVRLNLPSGPVEWKARLSRLSDSIDPKTRTVGVIVVVDDSYFSARPGERPPLVKNMYCEVELRGRPHSATVVLPRSAVREGRVRVVGADLRLETREVAVDAVQGDLVALRSGVQPGERVVATDVIPAIEGMLLEPVDDAELLAHVIREASGGAGTP